MVSTEFGTVIDVSFSIPEKAYASTSVTPSGIVSSVIRSQPTKAYTPISRSPRGSSISRRLLHFAKVEFGMDVIALESVAFFRAVQSAKTDMPKVSTESGILISDKEIQ